jgi:hypothetical protein
MSSSSHKLAWLVGVAMKLNLLLFFPNFSKPIIKRAYQDRKIHKKFECRANWIAELMCPLNLTEFLHGIVEQFQANLVLYVMFIAKKMMCLYSVLLLLIKWLWGCCLTVFPGQKKNPQKWQYDFFSS